MKTCLNCGAEVPDHAQVCERCRKNPNIMNIEVEKPSEKDHRDEEKIIRKLEKAAGFAPKARDSLGLRPSAQAMTDLPGQGLDKQGKELRDVKRQEKKEKEPGVCKDCGSKYYDDICPQCGRQPSVQTMTDMPGIGRKKKKD